MLQLPAWISAGAPSVTVRSVLDIEPDVKDMLCNIYCLMEWFSKVWADTIARGIVFLDNELKAKTQGITTICH